MNDIIHRISNYRPVINLLGEVCWGFHIDDFEKKIGQKKDVVENLLQRLLQEEKNGAEQIILSESELKIVRRCLDEVEKEIEGWEFSIRMGTTLGEIKSMPIFKLP